MKKLKILVLDDCKDFIFLVSSLLNFYELDVDTVTDSSEALEKGMSTKYDIIITDYMMEPIDGLEFSEKVRKEGANKETTMFLLTMKELEASEIEKVNKYNLIYLKKPIMPNLLYSKLMESLEK